VIWRLSTRARIVHPADRLIGSLVRVRCLELIDVLGAGRRPRLIGHERGVSLVVAPQLLISSADAVVGAKRVVALLGDAVLGIDLGRI
jgi:hypothetical protein